MRMQGLPKGQIIENGKRYYRSDGKKSGYMRVVEKTYYDPKYKVSYWNNGSNEIPDNCLLSEVDEERESRRQMIAAMVLTGIVESRHYMTLKVEQLYIDSAIQYTDSLMAKLDQ